MDAFVSEKLREWGLSEYIQKFRDEEVDKKSLYLLDDHDIDILIPKLGSKAKFKKGLKMLLQDHDEAAATAQQDHDEAAATAQEDHDEAADTAQEDHDEAADTAQEDHDEAADTAQEDQDEAADTAQEDHDEAADTAQVCPSTSGTSNAVKRRSDLRGESSKDQSSPSKKQRGKNLSSSSEEIILAKVKNKMRNVQIKLENGEDTKLNAFLKAQVYELEMEKRELVGVFGKTGAGKSSLINAVIGVKDLLPSGDVTACTSVMIKVEANMKNSKYEAEIEFITKKEWEDELWCMDLILKDTNQQESEDDYQDTIEKLSAVYGEEWKGKSPENLKDIKYFREIPEFFQNRRKILTSESAREISAKFLKYTRDGSTEGQDSDIKRWYWPLVKCVTVRVPNNELLRYVTLVDLPGNGDHNKSRDRMWKEIVGCCSTVWIVTEFNRAASETEAWEILTDASGMMGNGGECQLIDFICTKSDLIDDSGLNSAAEVRAAILKKNMCVKEKVISKFGKQNKIKKHFSPDCFRVFTVSSREFLKKKHLTPDDTEIPKLKEFLRDLNDCHSDTLNYVSRAYGILSLIEGARRKEVAGKKNACTDLEEIMRNELEKVKKPIDEAYMVFEKCLTEGVEKAKSSCEVKLHGILNPKGVSGRGFWKKLKHLVENGGTYKPKKKKEINFNENLSSFLTDSIDEEFRKTFPAFSDTFLKIPLDERNERKCGPFNGVINAFSLDTARMIEKYKDVELQLTFLKTEEEKIKTKLNKIICDRKKVIYGILVFTVGENMQEGYKKAAAFRGQDTLENMRGTLQKHLNVVMDTMYTKAKDVLLACLKKLRGDILQELEKTLTESIELSFKTDDDSIPDVSAEFCMVKKYHNQLIGNQD